MGLTCFNHDTYYEDLYVSYLDCFKHAKYGIYMTDYG
jgi:hypothetical protein